MRDQICQTDLFYARAFGPSAPHNGRRAQPFSPAPERPSGSRARRAPRLHAPLARPSRSSPWHCELPVRLHLASPEPAFAPSDDIARLRLLQPLGPPPQDLRVVHIGPRPKSLLCDLLGARCCASSLADSRLLRPSHLSPSPLFYSPAPEAVGRQNASSMMSP